MGLLLAFIGALSVLAIACGTDDGGDTGGSSSAASASSKIVSPDRTFTVDDLMAAGFKKSKEYDVTGLEGAVSAVYGFFGLDPYNRQEYEVRFYATHQDALNIGTSWADEATGPNAVVLESVQRWDEGLTERRQCAGNGGHHSGKCDNAKYGDYMIVGNMILMCQGKDSGSAIKNCDALLAQMS